MNNPEWLPKQRRIFTYDRCGWDYHSSMRMTWNGDTLEPMDEVSEEVLSPNEDRFHISVYRYRDGNPVLLKEWVSRKSPQPKPGWEPGDPLDLSN